MYSEKWVSVLKAHISLYKYMQNMNPFIIILKQTLLDSVQKHYFDDI